MAPAEKKTTVPKSKGCMRLIVDGKSRRGSFKKRKLTLKNKASELATLCDVMVCMVCFGPDGEVDAWPENKTEVRNRINSYQRLGQKGKQKAKQNYNLLGFLENKMKKLEQKLSKGKEVEQSKSTETWKENIGNMFSKWDAKLEQFSPEELMGLCNSLDSKLQNLREKIRLTQIKEDEQEIQACNGDSNIIANPGNYLNMMNDCCQPLLSFMFNGAFCYNQQAFGGALWPRECYTVAGSSSSGSGDFCKNRSSGNFSWDGYVDYGRQQNFDYLGVNYNSPIPVGDNNRNFSLGFAQANTGLRAQENFGSMGESRGNIILGPSQYSMFAPTSIHGVLPISKRR